MTADSSGSVLHSITSQNVLVALHALCVFSGHEPERILRLRPFGLTNKKSKVLTAVDYWYLFMYCRKPKIKNQTQTNAEQVINQLIKTHIKNSVYNCIQLLTGWFILQNPRHEVHSKGQRPTPATEIIAGR